MRAVKADVFEEMTRLGAQKERFDIVIADPPPFVKSRKDLEPGAKAYRKLARLAADITAPGGLLLLASCSHNIPLERFAAECAAGILKGGRGASLIHSAGAGADHPVHPLLPESAYLKALVYALRLDRLDSGVPEFRPRRVPAAGDRSAPATARSTPATYRAPPASG